MKTSDSSGADDKALEAEPLWQRAHRLLQPGPGEHYPPCPIPLKGPGCPHVMLEHWRVQFAWTWAWMLYAWLEAPPKQPSRLMRNFLLELAEITHFHQWHQDSLPSFTYLLNIGDWLLSHHQRRSTKSQRGLERVIGQAAHARILQVIQRNDLEGTIELRWNANWTEWVPLKGVRPEKLARSIDHSIRQVTKDCEQLENALAWFQSLSPDQAEKVRRAWVSLGHYHSQRDKMYQNRPQSIEKNEPLARPDEPLWQYIARMVQPGPGEHYPPCEVLPQGPVCPWIQVELSRKRLIDAYKHVLKELVSLYAGKNHTLAHHVLTHLVLTTLSTEANPPQLAFELNDEDWHVAHANNGCAVRHNLDWVVDQALQARIFLRTHEQDYLGTVGLCWNANWTEWEFLPDLELSQRNEKRVKAFWQYHEHWLLSACAEIEQELLVRQDPGKEKAYQEWVALERSWLEYEKLAAEAGIAFQ